jgi:hypothetical protein
MLELQDKIVAQGDRHRSELDTMRAECAAKDREIVAVERRSSDTADDRVEGLRVKHGTEMDDLELRLKEDYDLNRQALEHELNDLRQQLDELLLERTQRRDVRDELESQLESADIEISELKAMNESLVDEINKRRVWRHEHESKKAHDDHKRPFYPPSFAPESPKVDWAPVHHTADGESPQKLTFTAPPVSYAKYVPVTSRTASARRKPPPKPKFAPKEAPPGHLPGKSPRFSHVPAKTDSTSAYESVAAVNAAAFGAMDEFSSLGEGEGDRKPSAGAIPQE